MPIPHSYATGEEPLPQKPVRLYETENPMLKWAMQFLATSDVRKYLGKNCPDDAYFRAARAAIQKATGQGE